MDPNPMTGFPLRRGGFGHRDTRTNEGIPCKNRQIFGVTQLQGTPRIVAMPKPGRGKR